MPVTCGCIKGIYNPIITPLNGKAFTYTDGSVWMEGGVYTSEHYEVVVSNPYNNNTPTITIPITGSIPLNATDLGLSEECIPDDVYCFKATTCGETFTAFKFLYGNTQELIDELMARGDDRYRELLILVNRIRVLVEHNDISTAQEYMDILKFKTKNINCDACCCKK